MDEDGAKAQAAPADAPPSFLQRDSHTPAAAAADAAAKTSALRRTSTASQNAAQNAAASATAENKANSSRSADSSVKDEEVSGGAPYGTRSRNRSTTRPNYADESDGEIENSIRADPAHKSKQSKTADSALKLKLNPELSSAAARGNPLSPMPAINGDHPQPEAAAGAGHSETVDPPPERKKRKYVWRTGSKPAPSARSQPNNLIPGTSRFLASSEDASATGPALKKRRVADGNSPSTKYQSNASGPARKRSISTSSKYGIRDSSIFTFANSRAVLKDGKLIADDGTAFAEDDHVYLVCEPPGDPYYLCRIMEFRRDDMDDPASPVTSMIVNWYYRPKDIGKTSNDTRFLFASMQSDESPLNSLRGKCQILHRSKINDLDEYRKQRDSFWFSQLYDRYIHRPYDLIPAEAVINVPENVKKAINERWKFLAVEQARLKEFTSAVKLCKRCNGYCAPNDSVDCGVCRNTYHMTCVRPPLSKKPTRGFAWSCAPCSRAREKKLNERHTTVLSGAGDDRDEEGHEDEDEAGAVNPEPSTVAPSSIGDVLEQTPETQSENSRAQKWLWQQWPWRYLGIHCKVEDVLQSDDRAIYPRASSRLGPRHQAAVVPWFGRPVELVKPADSKRRFGKGAGSKKDNFNKKETKLPKETPTTHEADKAVRAIRPKWVQDAPSGYIARGEDLDSSDPNCTAERLFVGPQQEVTGVSATNGEQTRKEAIIDDYMDKVREIAKESGFARALYPIAAGHTSTTSQDILPTNFIDKALNLLHKNNFDATVALQQVSKIQTAKEFGDPVLTKEETKKFEEGVARYGSELRFVRKNVKSRPQSQITRFYYAWKKTERGQEIWGRHDGRRGSKKRAATSWTEIADEDDDSAFDNEKSIAKKRKFQCKFCHTKSSSFWRRAPDIAPGAVVLADPKGSAKDKANQLVLALCLRCTIPWRRYGLRWEDTEEVAKVLQQTGGRAWKRKYDEEIIRELVIANEVAGVHTGPLASAAAAALGITTSVSPPDLKKKKIQENDSAPISSLESQQKKKAPVAPPRPPTPPIVPQEPKLREFPCAVCGREGAQDTVISCTHCRLAVHRSCFSVPEHVSPTNWICDACVNDKSGSISFNYNCVLCTVADRQPDMAEPPKATHKKKTERDKEKERLEKELADELVATYKKQQIAKGRPPFPREAVKSTANNNWMHVTCAVWTPEVKFNDAVRMEGAEGMATIMATPVRMDGICKLCRVVKGACVSCHQCHATFHVECAHEAGYTFGFDVTPIKGSRKDSVSTVTLGSETGAMTAAIWCKDHEQPKAVVHDIHEVLPETGLTALQTFVRTYKQADLTITGTARKATLLSQSTKASAQSSSTSARRASLLNNGISSKRARSPPSPSEDDSKNLTNGIHSQDLGPDERHCVTCGTECSFKWWLSRHPTNGTNSVRPESLWQCHKCYLLSSKGVKPTAAVVEENEASHLSHQADFFELTMPTPQHQQQSMPLVPPQPAQGYPPAPAAGYAGAPPAVPYTPGPAQPAIGPMVHGSNQQPAVPGKGADQDQRNIERWTRDLWASTVVITHVTGQVYRFRGHEFGTLNDPPTVAWNHLIGRSQQEFGFDPNEHVIVTEDGLRIIDSNVLMRALAKILSSGVIEAHWVVENMPLPARSHFWPGVGAFQHQTQLYPPASGRRNSSRTPPTAAGPLPPTVGANYPRPGAPPGPPQSLPHAHSRPHSPQYPSNNAQQHGIPHASPYGIQPGPRGHPGPGGHPQGYPQGSPQGPPFYPQPQSPTLSSSAMQTIPSNVNASSSTSPRAPGVRPKTPAELRSTGASSSPNLKNLVH